MSEVSQDTNRGPSCRGPAWRWREWTWTSPASKEAIQDEVEASVGLESRAEGEVPAGMRERRSQVSRQDQVQGKGKGKGWRGEDDRNVPVAPVRFSSAVLMTW